MPFRTILTVCSSNAPDKDLKMAAALCKEANAHLSLLVIGVALSPPMGEAAVLSETWVKERDAEIKAMAERAESAKALLQTYDISWDIGQEYSEAISIDDEVGMRAHYSDLIMLLPSLLQNGPVCPPVLEGAIFRSARPLLLVPDGTIPTLAPKKVLVAWNSRQEVARAVHYAVDFLRQADSVNIVMVDPIARRFGNGEEPGADLAAYLARHGAKVVVEPISSKGRDISEVLNQHAQDTCAEMMVMGAYGHSRLRERLFGGVTRAFLKKSPVPILMAH